VNGRKTDKKMDNGGGDGKGDSLPVACLVVTPKKGLPSSEEE